MQASQVMARLLLKAENDAGVSLTQIENDQAAELALKHLPFRGDNDLAERLLFQLCYNFSAEINRSLDESSAEQDLTAD